MLDCKADDSIFLVSCSIYICIVVQQKSSSLGESCDSYKLVAQRGLIGLISRIHVNFSLN